MPDADALVPLMLAAAGITPSPDEVAALVAAYPVMRAKLDALHAVAEAAGEEPGLVFSAVV